MKITSINVQIIKNPKQYEAVRFGLEATLEPGENEAEAIKAADQFLRDQYAAIYGQPLQKTQPVQTAATSNPKPAPSIETTAKEQPASDKRERLEFSDKRVQQIVRRMEAQPGRAKEILEQTLKYFDPTEEVMKTLNLAAKLV